MQFHPFRLHAISNTLQNYVCSFMCFMHILQSQSHYIKNAVREDYHRGTI